MLSTFVPVACIDQQMHPIALDHLVLYSDWPGSSIAYDPGYVFVHFGEDYHWSHGEARYNVGTAKISFDFLFGCMSACECEVYRPICPAIWQGLMLLRSGCV